MDSSGWSKLRFRDAWYFRFQGTFLANNSDDDTITRNSGIFWAMNMSSAVIGNLIAYFLFQDQEIIEKDTWMTLGAILTSVAGAGILMMFALRPTPWVEKKDDVNMISTMKGSANLFSTSTMLMFSLTLFFTGLNQSLWAGVYSACIGFTEGSVHGNYPKIFSISNYWSF